MSIQAHKKGQKPKRFLILSLFGAFRQFGFFRQLLSVNAPVACDGLTRYPLARPFSGPIFWPFYATSTLVSSWQVRLTLGVPVNCINVCCYTLIWSKSVWNAPIGGKFFDGYAPWLYCRTVWIEMTSLRVRDFVAAERPLKIIAVSRSDLCV